MIRNLKVLFAAALALTALGAIAASAQAAHEFHCSVSPCRIRALPDETVGTATAHHVFIVETPNTKRAVSFTCNQFTGDTEYSGNTTKSLAITAPAYDTCKVNGSPGVVVDMRTCTYTFTGEAAGTSTGPLFNGTARVHVTCSTAGDKIEVTVPGGCVFKIGPQELSGIGYHNIGAVGARSVTVTANVHGIAVTATGCSALIEDEGEGLTGTYTTGNTIVTGETPAGVGGEVMADGWFE